MTAYTEQCTIPPKGYCSYFDAILSPPDHIQACLYSHIAFQRINSPGRSVPSERTSASSNPSLAVTAVNVQLAFPSDLYVFYDLRLGKPGGCVRAWERC